MQQDWAILIGTYTQLRMYVHASVYFLRATAVPAGTADC